MARINNKQDIKNVVLAKANTELSFEIKGKTCMTTIYFDPNLKERYKVNIGGGFCIGKTKSDIIDSLYNALMERGWKESLSITKNEPKLSLEELVVEESNWKSLLKNQLDKIELYGSDRGEEIRVETKEIKGYDGKEALKNRVNSQMEECIGAAKLKVKDFNITIHVNDVGDYENDWLASVVFIAKK